MKRDKRIKNLKRDNSPFISMGDLFASMVGIMMLVLLFLMTNKEVLSAVTWGRVYKTLEKGYLAKMEYKGVLTESIICDFDSLTIASLDYKIPLKSIATDNKLREFLNKIYTNGGRITQVIHSGGNDSLRMLGVVMRELKYYKVFELRTHENLDYVKDKKVREQIRKGTWQ